MKDSLKPGLRFTFQYPVPEDKTVPFLYLEAAELQKMPKVLATGFMVGLFEWTCIQAINPHIDWPREQTVGIGLNLNHLAATPPGLTVNVEVKLEEVDGRRLVFSIAAALADSAMLMAFGRVATIWGFPLSATSASTLPP